MKNLSRYKRSLSYIISITFILMSFLSAVHFCCFDENFYTSEHNKIKLYGKSISEHIGINDEELKTLTSFTLDYLNDPNASLDLVMNINGQDREVFTNDEKAHMVDVRKLNLNSIYLDIFSVVLFIICFVTYLLLKCDFKYLFKSYKNTLIYILIFFSILGLWIFLDFNSFWTLFHKIFFAGNDLWILDLRKDILIMIVPPQFFNDLVIRILILFVSIICVFGIILYLLSRKKIEDD